MDVKNSDYYCIRLDRRTFFLMYFSSFVYRAARQSKNTVCERESEGEVSK